MNLQTNEQAQATGISTPVPGLPEKLLLEIETKLKEGKAANIPGSDPATPHQSILVEILEKIQPIDFKAIIYPGIKALREQLAEPGISEHQAEQIQKQMAKMKPLQKELIVISVDEVIRVAEGNKWGMCKNHDFIYLYNGCYWNQIENESMQAFLIEAAEKLGVEPIVARHFIFGEHMYKQFLSRAFLPTPEPNNKVVQINLLNGTFEVGNNGTRLKKHDRNDFLTYQLSFNYDPKATAPIFSRYLNRVIPDVERQKVLAEYLGYIFTKNGGIAPKIEKALLLYGGGQNGKSVFFDVTTALMGEENVSTFSLQSLTEEKGFYRAKIANKLLNYASEINGKLEASIFKTMVSGEPVEACLKYGQPFKMRDYAKMIFNVNELPRDVEHTEAFFRRFLIVPFDEIITEDEKDLYLSKKIIEAELSGVFNWVLEGLNRLLSQKNLSRCKAAEMAVSQYKLESNSIEMFMTESGYVRDPLSYTTMKELYSEYRCFCVEDGLIPFKKVNFSKQLRAMNYTVERMTGNQVCVFISKQNSY